ncbi:GNAT family N-acetyltransferase [Reinekea blandensis]|uniref:Acetyltransferase n=1 Tax=Reinekea blandensis MED297 TaxID=314283 RepID=A4BCR0_9GAMM|nr:GNAT family N-acetyltransferase [Reinekea blandensis]EAR09992.1 acetyltransferase [Reinekea sp. MED297] [Reinekea blandensis MED297]
MLNLSFREAQPADKAWAFDIKSEAEYPYVQAVFGWEPKVQQTLHEQEWQRTTPTVIEADGERIGFFSLETEGERCYLRRFFLDARYRQRGVGGWVLQQIRNAESIRQSGLWVVVFSANPAVMFYERLGFQRVDGDERFVTLYWSAPDPQYD